MYQVELLEKHCKFSLNFTWRSGQTVQSPISNKQNFFLRLPPDLDTPDFMCLLVVIPMASKLYEH